MKMARKTSKSKTHERRASHMSSDTEAKKPKWDWKSTSSNGHKMEKRLQFKSKTVSTQKEKHSSIHDLYLKSSPEHHH